MLIKNFSQCSVPSLKAENSLKVSRIEKDKETFSN